MIKGRCWKFGDDVNTDVIHPPEFFSLDANIVRLGLFHGFDPEIQPQLRRGDIIIAGRNFGCGSSRETCVRSLLLNGIGAIVAVDFARIFYRSATNNGLLCIMPEDPEALSVIRNGETVEISLGTSAILTESGDRICLQPIEPFVQCILRAGGLLSFLDPDVSNKSVQKSQNLIV